MNTVRMFYNNVHLTEKNQSVGWETQPLRLNLRLLRRREKVNHSMKSVCASPTRPVGWETLTPTFEI